MLHAPHTTAIYHLSCNHGTAVPLLWTLDYSVQYVYTVHHSTVQYSTVQYNPILVRPVDRTGRSLFIIQSLHIRPFVGPPP